MHRWNLSPKEAISLQLDLAKYLAPSRKKMTGLEKIAGVDVSFSGKRCCGAICIFSYPDLKLIEQKTSVCKVKFPYVPTLLTFREGPVILECFKKIENRPDAVLFDGQGIAHPRKMGLAAHMGLWIDLPTIGCAKTPLYGEFTLPPPQKGAYVPIKAKGRIIGAVLRTRSNVKPVFISQGYKITLEDAIGVTLSCCSKFRLPEPFRAAHTLSKTTLARGD